MLYNLESELGDHSLNLKSALKNWDVNDPDMVIITEDGSKIFTKSIIFSIYSKKFCDILSQFNSPEMPSISLPISSSSPVLNLLKILIEGSVSSTDYNALLEVGKVAKILDIKLEGMQLGSIKKFTKDAKKEECETNHEKEDIIYSSMEESVSENWGLQEELQTNFKKESLGSLDGVVSKNNARGHLECIVCGKICSNKQALKRHKMLHTGAGVTLTSVESTSEKEEEVDASNGIVGLQKACDTCGKICANKQALQRHTMRHTGERPFKCDECGKEFIRITQLKQHKCKTLQTA